MTVNTASRLVFSPLKERILSASLITFGAIAPMLLHAAGGNGRVFLPLFFALSLGAVGLGLPMLFALALAAPLLNHFLFGMPAAPMLYTLLWESFVFTAGIGIGRRLNAPFYLMLAVSFIAARLCGAAGVFLIPSMSFSVWAENFSTGLIGIAANILLGSAFYFLMKKRDDL